MSDPLQQPQAASSSNLPESIEQTNPATSISNNCLPESERSNLNLPPSTSVETTMYAIPEMPSPLDCPPNADATAEDPMASSVLVNHLNNIEIANHLLVSNPDQSANVEANSCDIPDENISNVAGGSRGFESTSVDPRDQSPHQLNESDCEIEFSDEDGEESDDAADKGNEKPTAISRRSRGGITRTNGTKDSNVILTNTEHLCRLLNITMESIMEDSRSLRSMRQEDNQRDNRIELPVTPRNLLAGIISRRSSPNPIPIHTMQQTEHSGDNNLDSEAVGALSPPHRSPPPEPRTLSSLELLEERRTFSSELEERRTFSSELEERRLQQCQCDYPCQNRRDCLNRNTALAGGSRGATRRTGNSTRRSGANSSPYR